MSCPIPKDKEQALAWLAPVFDKSVRQLAALPMTTLMQAWFGMAWLYGGLHPDEITNCRHGFIIPGVAGLALGEQRLARYCANCGLPVALVGMTKVMRRLYQAGKLKDGEYYPCRAQMTGIVHALNGKEQHMNITEATTILSVFFREEAGKILPPEKSAPLLEAWALVEPELPDENRIHDSWHISDVAEALEEHFNVPANTLTDDEKRQVLHEVADNQDANHGITWDDIYAAIESLFSDVIEEAQAKEEDKEP